MSATLVILADLRTETARALDAAGGWGDLVGDVQSPSFGTLDACNGINEIRLFLEDGGAGDRTGDVAALHALGRLLVALTGPSDACSTCGLDVGVPVIDGMCQCAEPTRGAR